jgi:trk system potassium uptake protein TrkA
VEVRIPDGAKAVGVAIKDLGLPKECLIAGIIRQNEMILPSGSTLFQAGDEVLAVTDQRGEQQLNELFTD